MSHGLSLMLSRARSVAVDPFFEIDKEILCDVHLVRTSSDEFFAREHPFAHLAEPLVDLVFIDGMHMAEYALRDVINTERYTHPATVIVIDDMLPRNIGEADRVQPPRGGAWTGDVYKITEAFRDLRPDWVCLEVNTEPTGTVVLLGPDARSAVLLEAYDDLVTSYVTPDPQAVPEAVLTRSRAIEPEDLLAAPIWDRLRELRSVPANVARIEVAALLRGAGLRTPA
ncbi:MAG: class I SAM-dependent methyltransferase [Marmoricola sp.]